MIAHNRKVRQQQGGKKARLQFKSQVESRLEQYIRNGHPTDKVEIIVMEAFTSRAPGYQDEFLREHFQHLMEKNCRLRKRFK